MSQNVDYPYQFEIYSFRSLLVEMLISVKRKTDDTIRRNWSHYMHNFQRTSSNMNYCSRKQSFEDI